MFLKFARIIHSVYAGRFLDIIPGVCDSLGLATWEEDVISFFFSFW
jgi:hypothetical protein